MNHKMVRNALILFLLAVVMVLLAGCSTSSSMSLTFDVESGEKIEVKLMNAKKKRLAADDAQFYVADDDHHIIDGFFVTAEMYEQYRASIADEGVEMNETNIDGHKGFSYSYEGDAGTENNCMFMVSDETGVVIASLDTPNVVGEVLAHMDFTVQ